MNTSFKLLYEYTDLIVVVKNYTVTAKFKAAELTL